MVSYRIIFREFYKLNYYYFVNKYMVIKEKKKTKKQKGGLYNTEFNYLFGDKPKNVLPTTVLPKNNTIKNFINTQKNKIYSKNLKDDFIIEIRSLFNQPKLQIPVFYGNMSEQYKNYGYNEYICKEVTSKFSSNKRIFIINPFAVLVYRIYLLCIKENYNTPAIGELYNLLKKLLKLDNFYGFPKLKYLPNGIKFCIVKDKNGVEEVIASEEAYKSQCEFIFGCSLGMTAEIRKENLPSDEDIIKLLNILSYDDKLRGFYNNSKKNNKNLRF